MKKRESLKHMQNSEKQSKLVRSSPGMKLLVRTSLTMLGQQQLLHQFQEMQFSQPVSQNGTAIETRQKIATQYGHPRSMLPEHFCPGTYAY
jgi:hypothetical protein